MSPVRLLGPEELHVGRVVWFQHREYHHAPYGPCRLCADLVELLADRLASTDQLYVYDATPEELARFQLDEIGAEDAL